MLAAVYRGHGRVGIEQVSKPKAGPGEIVVAVKRCGVCPTDLKKIRHDLVPPPRVFGHEMAGIIAEVGPGVEAWSEGERVAVFHHVPCRECHYCRRGSYAQCPQYQQTGTVAAFEPAGGGFAEFVLVKSWIVREGMVRIPERLTLDEASLLEPLATCLKAALRCQPRSGDTAVVLGQGPIGLMLTGLLSYLNATVFAIEPRQDRARWATAFGATKVLPTAAEEAERSVREFTDGRGADAVVLTITASSALEAGMRLVRPGGKVVLFADTYLGGSVALDPGIICYREVELIGSYSCDITLQNRAAEILFGRVRDWASLITHVVPLHEIERALELAENPPEDALKVVVAP